MIRGKYLRERKAMRIKRRFKFLVVVTIILIIYKILCDSFSLFESQATSNANIDIAFFLVNDQYYIADVDEDGNAKGTKRTENIKIADIKPGESKDYTIWVSNYGYFDSNGQQVESDKDGEKRVADTNIEYTLNIKTTTNLPLKYELLTTTGLNNEKTTNVIERQAEVGNDGMYFKSIFSGSKKLDFNVDDQGISHGQQDTYRLRVTLPEKYKDAKYQDIIEYIEVSIDAKQIINN